MLNYNNRLPADADWTCVQRGAEKYLPRFYNKRLT